MNVELIEKINLDFFRWEDVGPDVEFWEECQENESLADDDVCKQNRITAIVVVELKRLSYNSFKSTCNQTNCLVAIQTVNHKFDYITS